MFRFSPGGPEDKVGTLLLERLVELQVLRSKMALNLHTMWRSAKTYSFGAVSVVYKDKLLKRSRPGIDSELADVGIGSENKVERAFGHGALVNIDAYAYLPDPNVPLENVQDGEFVGWRDRTNYVSMRREEIDNENVFNVRYLMHMDDCR